MSHKNLMMFLMLNHTFSMCMLVCYKLFQIHLFLSCLMVSCAMSIFVSLVLFIFWHAHTSGMFLKYVAAYILKLFSFLNNLFWKMWFVLKKCFPHVLFILLFVACLITYLLMLVMVLGYASTYYLYINICMFMVVLTLLLYLIFWKIF